MTTRCRKKKKVVANAYYIDTRGEDEGFAEEQTDLYMSNGETRSNQGLSLELKRADAHKILKHRIRTSTAICLLFLVLRYYMR
jgi:hypothetical protein